MREIAVFVIGDWDDEWERCTLNRQGIRFVYDSVELTRAGVTVKCPFWANANFTFLKKMQ